MVDRQEDHQEHVIMLKEDGKKIRKNELPDKKEEKSVNVINIPDDTPALTKELLQEVEQAIKSYWKEKESNGKN